MASAIDLSGRCALITGAGQGIGETISAMLSAAGASVLVNDIDHQRRNGGRQVATFWWSRRDGHF